MRIGPSLLGSLSDMGPVVSRLLIASYISLMFGFRNPHGFRTHGTRLCLIGERKYTLKK